jgi:hypothetical protein
LKKMDHVAVTASTLTKLASSVFVWSQNRADILDGNEYKIWKWLVLKFHGSGHLPNHTTSKWNVWKWPLSKLCLLLMFFLVLKPQCTAKWHVFYIRNRHISVGSFVYKYDQWPHDSYMTGRAGAWEADDIVKFYIALLDFFPATL